MDEEGGLIELTYDLFEVTDRQQETKIQSGTQPVHTADRVI